ncbi:MAG: tetratricopeptide repeat protein [Anaerolineae bacterium]|nr:tetratricopeptide repeat protein [Anaerolineae bacterium]
MTITITLFGPFQAIVDGLEATAFRSDKARALLAYVAAAPDQAHARDALATLLWGEQDDASARTNLRNVLSNVRKVTDSAENGSALDITRQAVQLMPGVAVDTVAFENLLRETDQHPHQDKASCAHCVAITRQALTYYRGDFLAHLYVADAPAFDDWSAVMRENLRQKAVEALHFVADYHTARGEYDAAMPFARSLAEMEPWEEDVHAQLMRLLAWQGQRTAALRHFDMVQRVLDDELGIAPSPELEQLRRQIENAASERPHNLPAQATSFVGRNEELAQLTALLAHTDCRLITVIGPGGIGKTRLALQAAQRAAADYLGPFLDGVFFVSLAGVDSADFVPTAVADALSLTLSGRNTPGREVAAYLRRRQLLLVLDNLEPLQQDDRLIDWLDALLRDAPDVKLLVTSRVALNIGAEWTVDLSGLPYPASAETQPVETLLHYDAVALFVQRVRQLNNAFALTAQTPACTVRICQSVNGIPLALELAAGWIKLLSCCEIASEIERNIDLLATNRRDLPSRHRSMRAVFDYSWVLLNSAEQRVLMALSVFRGGFERQAATAVTDISLFTLDELVSTSWLRVTTNAANETTVSRYLMLEPLRQYAAEQLGYAADNAEITFRDRHAAHYLTMATAQAMALRTNDLPVALAALRDEIENIRAAWLWASERGHTALLDGALDALFDYYEIRSQFREGRHLLQTAFDTVDTSIVDTDAFVVRLEARLGWLSFHAGDVADGTAHLQHALDKARSAELQGEIVFALNYLGAIARLQTRIDDAEALLHEALTLAQASGDRFGAGIALNNLSQAALQRGDLAKAKELATESLIRKEAIGDRRGSAFSHLYLAQIDAALGDYDAALQQFAAAADVYAALHDRRGLALTQRSLGDTFVQAGDAASAIAAYASAARLFDAIGFVAEAEQVRSDLNRLAAA